MPHCIPLPFLSFCSSERTSPFLRPTLRHDSPRCLYRDFLYDLQRTTRLSLPLFGGGGARRNLLFPLVISARPFAREDPTSLARKISAIVRKRRENFRFELRIRIRETCFQRTGLFPRRIEQRIVTKTLIGDMRVAWKKIPRNGVRRLGGNRRGVDRGCRTYIYIYSSNKKNGQIPHGKSTTFSHRSNNRHFRSERKGIESLSELNPVTG